MTNEQEPNPDRDRFMRFIIRSTQVATAQIAAKDPYIQLDEESRLRALNALDYAQKAPEAWPQMYELLMVLAPKMEMDGYRGPWIEYLRRGIACSQQQQDYVAEGELSLQIGYLYHLISRGAEAKCWLHQSRTCFCKTNDKSGEGRALNRLAMVALREENLSEATKFVTQAQARLDTTHADQANSCFVLGAIAEQQRHWEEAENYYRQSLKYWTESKDKRRIAWGLRNLGPILRWRKKLDEAIECYNNALQIFLEIHDPLNQAATKLNLGNVYLETGQYEKALVAYEQAESVFQAVADPWNLSKISVNKGIAYENLGRLQSAEDSFIQSIEVLTSLNLPILLCNAMDCLGELYRKQRKFQKAAHIYTAALEILTNIKNESAYIYYHEMVTNHLARAQVGDANQE